MVVLRRQPLSTRRPSRGGANAWKSLFSLVNNRSGNSGAETKIWPSGSLNILLLIDACNAAYLVSLIIKRSVGCNPS